MQPMPSRWMTRAAPISPAKRARVSLGNLVHFQHACIRVEDQSRRFGGACSQCFLGGNSYEYATDIAVDSAHNIYVVGNTYSTDFPVRNAAQPTKGGGSSNNHDAFVTKIQADGSALIYSTYLGGSKTDEASGIAVDDLGNAYITGMTQSTDFPIQECLPAGLWRRTGGCLRDETQRGGQRVCLFHLPGREQR